MTVTCHENPVHENVEILRSEKSESISRIDKDLKTEVKNTDEQLVFSTTSSRYCKGKMIFYSFTKQQPNQNVVTKILVTYLRIQSDSYFCICSFLAESSCKDRDKDR